MPVVISIILGIVVGYILNMYMEFKDRKDKPYKWYIEFFYKKKDYVIVEIITVLSFLFVYFKLGKINLEYFEYIFILSIILSASMVDIRTKRIPNKIIIFGIFGLSLFILMNFRTDYIITTLLGIVVTLLILAPISIISKGSFGMGDVKLYSLIGGFLGLSALLSCLFFSTMIAAAIGIVLMVFKKAEKKSTIPLAPFIFMGTLLTILLV